ncbi:60S ribosomal protein L15 [Tupaia chinensis]|uniref:Ribosomal protein L15 n=2 Tax=Tupaia chinensis TaxID=246437 RepID=L8Y695_TUPCH|nr:60S ribosomal protein L15 [Tupaia chinensis]
MGTYKYIQELWRKKQSDLMRFLLWVCCWPYRQLLVLHWALRPTWPDKACRLGYKVKQVYVIYRICVWHGGCKRPVPKGTTYGKPVHHGINQLKFARSLQSVVEE